MQPHHQDKEQNMSTVRKLRGPEINFDSDEQKNLIEQAAKSRGLSVTAFMRSSSLKAANDVLREDQLLRLSDRDWELASSTLESPPEPNEALKNLLK
jgi:uncharacterized protein (DUF1778 family)